MQIIVTHGSLARTRVLQLGAWQLAACAVALLLLMLALSGTVYHLVFLKAAREGWPGVSRLVALVVQDEFAQRDRFMRENLDAMAERVGEIQARLVRLETVSERVSGLAGLKPEEVRVGAGGGRGGPFLPASRPSLEQLNRATEALDELSQQRLDVFTLIESRLFEQRLTNLRVPSTPPVAAPVGSGFGFRLDPFSGRNALHTGLDFAADVGTPILAAAGGVVQVAERHPQYGLMIDLDHRNGLVTRYAHASRLLVGVGDIVRRGQPIAQVGSTGRSTGPHLHFEVLVDGVPQNPAKFLAPDPASRQAPRLAVR
ncbi:M23 family metallopeptidase [Caldimonas tepidiphila]|uniref:M23 family metallopeptidase n=1 Tax=Caldimonas tepidiphila TaxID=2315841 RepID=UPI000E5B7B95|nr:M23 family metallopeptidase [Caldimonas tepidiphila]